MKNLFLQKADKTFGFSLVELLLVLFIMALVAAIGIPILYKNSLKANERAAQSNLHAIYLAETTIHVSCDSAAFTGNLFDLIKSTPPFLSNSKLKIDSETHAQDGAYQYRLTPGPELKSIPCTYITYPVTEFVITATPLGEHKGKKIFTINSNGEMTEALAFESDSTDSITDATVNSDTDGAASLER